MRQKRKWRTDKLTDACAAAQTGEVTVAQVAPGANWIHVHKYKGKRCARVFEVQRPATSARRFGHCRLIHKCTGLLEYSRNCSNCQEVSAWGKTRFIQWLLFFPWSIWSLSDDQQKEFSPDGGDQQWKHPGEWSCFSCFPGFSLPFLFVKSLLCVWNLARWSQRTKRGSAYIVAELLGTAKHKKTTFFPPSIKHCKAIWLWLTDRSFQSVFSNK